MSTLICFLKELAEPTASAVSLLATATAHNSAPAEEANGEGDGHVGSPGAEEEDAETMKMDQSSKSLTDPLWASEDLGRNASGDLPANRGSPGVPDSHRAISLDAVECLEESNQALVRSAALEDLTSIGEKRRLWTEQGEEKEEDVSPLPPWQATAEDRDIPLEEDETGNWGTNEVTSEHLQDVAPADPSRGPLEADPSEEPLEADPSEEPLEADRSEKPLEADPHSPYLNGVSDTEGLLETPPETVCEGGRAEKSTLDEAEVSDDGCTKSQITDDMETFRTETQNLSETPQSSPARKSMVPVPVFKGRFLLSIFTNRNAAPLQLIPPHPPSASECHTARPPPNLHPLHATLGGGLRAEEKLFLLPSAPSLLFCRSSIHFIWLSLLVMHPPPHQGDSLVMVVVVVVVVFFLCTMCHAACVTLTTHWLHSGLFLFAMHANTLENGQCPCCG